MGSQKKKKKEPFQEENLRATSSVLPNFNLKTLEKGAKKKREGTIPTRKSTCHFFCSPEFQSKNIGKGGQKKREGTIPTRKSTCHFFCSPEFQSKTLEKGAKKKKRRNHSNKKIYVPLLEMQEKERNSS